MDRLLEKIKPPEDSQTPTSPGYIDDVNRILQSSASHPTEQDKLTGVNWILGNAGNEMELKGRIVKCIYMMFLWYDVKTDKGVPVTRGRKSSNYDRILKLSNDPNMNRNILRKKINVGKRLIEHVITFGWPILFWDGLCPNKLQHIPGNVMTEYWNSLKNDDGKYNAIKQKIASKISNADARMKVVGLISNLIGNVEIISDIIGKIDSVDDFLLQKISKCL